MSEGAADIDFETKRLEKARHCLDQISDQWDAAITRLQAFVEEKT